MPHNRPNVSHKRSMSMDRFRTVRAAILQFDMVHVVDANSGAPMFTYGTRGKRGAGSAKTNEADVQLRTHGDFSTIVADRTIGEQETGLTKRRLAHVRDRNRIGRLQDDHAAPKGAPTCPSETGTLKATD